MKQFDKKLTNQSNEEFVVVKKYDKVNHVHIDKNKQVDLSQINRSAHHMVVICEKYCNENRNLKSLDLYFATVWSTSTLLFMKLNDKNLSHQGMLNVVFGLFRSTHIAIQPLFVGKLSNVIKRLDTKKDHVIFSNVNPDVVYFTGEHAPIINTTCKLHEVKVKEDVKKEDVKFKVKEDVNVKADVKPGPQTKRKYTKKTDKLAIKSEVETQNKPSTLK